MNSISKGILGIAAAGALALSFAAPASAARWHRGGAVAAGAAAGFVAGAAIASSQPRYYGDTYYDGGYAPSYGYAEDYGYPAGPSSRWYNGRYDSNGVNNN
jgi:hypothetical protein